MAYSDVMYKLGQRKQNNLDLINSQIPPVKGDLKAGKDTKQPGGIPNRPYEAPKEDPNKKPSIVPAKDDDGAGYVTAGGSHYGQYINMDGDDSKDNAQLIMKYRGTSMHPECDAAHFAIAGQRRLSPARGLT